MTTPQPTPKTDAAIKESGGQWSFVPKETCEKLESERDEARKQLEATHKAIRKAAYQLRYLAKEIDAGWDVRAGARQALDKLQPLIKP